MDQPELVKIAKRIRTLTDKIGEKRDEMRELLSEANSLVDSLDDVEESLMVTHGCLQNASAALDDAIDSASQYA